jgi:hypothetical protein
MDSIAQRVAIAKRRPVRITITIPCHVFENITNQADYQGRSTSNLAAYLLEEGLEAHRSR